MGALEVRTTSDPRPCLNTALGTDLPKRALAAGSSWLKQSSDRDVASTKVSRVPSNNGPCAQGTIAQIILGEEAVLHLWNSRIVLEQILPT